MRLFDRKVAITVARPGANEFFYTGFLGAIRRGFAAVGIGEKSLADSANGIVISDLRVRFKIEKSLGKQPNKAEVVISNLAPESRDRFTERPIVVHVQAGFGDELHHLFTGDLRYGSSEHVGTDWETTLLLGDGSRAFQHARVNRSYKPGTTVLTAVRDAARSLGLDVPASLVASPELQQQFASGLTLEGPTRNELTRLLAPYGYSWSIQDGRMRILRDTEVDTDSAILLVAGPNEAGGTGMIGSPKFNAPKSGKKKKKPPTVTVTHSLVHEATPGGKVRVKSAEVDGLFKIQKVAHTGDTADTPWHSELELRHL